MGIEKLKRDREGGPSNECDLNMQCNQENMSQTDRRSELEADVKSSEHVTYGTQNQPIGNRAELLPCSG
jgi:hypothetical protein